MLPLWIKTRLGSWCCVLAQWLSACLHPFCRWLIDSSVYCCLCPSWQEGILLCASPSEIINHISKQNSFKGNNWESTLLWQKSHQLLELIDMEGVSSGLQHGTADAWLSLHSSTTCWNTCKPLIAPRKSPIKGWQQSIKVSEQVSRDLQKLQLCNFVETAIPGRLCEKWWAPQIRTGSVLLAGLLRENKVAGREKGRKPWIPEKGVEEEAGDAGEREQIRGWAGDVGSVQGPVRGLPGKREGFGASFQITHRHAYCSLRRSWDDEH